MEIGKSLNKKVNGSIGLLIWKKLMDANLQYTNLLENKYHRMLIYDPVNNRLFPINNMQYENR